MNGAVGDTPGASEMIEKCIETRGVDELHPHHRQAELFPDLQGADFDELVASLDRDSLITPIEITTGNVVIDGHQRLRAAKQLGWTDIDVWVRTDLPDQD